MNGREVKSAGSSSFLADSLTREKIDNVADMIGYFHSKTLESISTSVTSVPCSSRQERHDVIE